MNNVFENPFTLAFLGTILVLCAPVCVLLCTGIICGYCCMGVYMHVHRPEVNSSCLPQSLYLTL